MYGRGIENMFLGFVCVVAVVCIVGTCAVIFGVPWLWSLIKPWLHAITG